MSEALVLLSGGQDSCTCLAWAKAQFEAVHTVSFFYGQKHVHELEQAKALSKIAEAKSHTIVPINSLEAIGNTNLIGTGNVNEPHPVNPSLPSSFVPGRNLIFLTLAAAVAYKKRIEHVVIGVSEEDFSGYPDCRFGAVMAQRDAIRLGFDMPYFQVHVPLIDIPKSGEVRWMQAWGKLDWYKHTHTCYNGVVPGCGECPACKLRAKSFADVGIPDPLFEGSDWVKNK